MEFNRFEFRVFLDLLPHQGWRTQSVLQFTHSWMENNWIHTFSKGISAMWNAISLVQDFELVSSCSFPTTITITPRAPPWNHYASINGDSSLFLLLVPHQPSVNFSSQPVVRGTKVSHHSCYCVILHCIEQIDKRTLHGVFFCIQSRYYIICSLVNTVDKIIFFSFQKYRWKEMFITMTRKICLLE